jgi:hypothetical protein
MQWPPGYGCHNLRFCALYLESKKNTYKYFFFPDIFFMSRIFFCWFHCLWYGSGCRVDADTLPSYLKSKSVLQTKFYWFLVWKMETRRIHLSKWWPTTGNPVYYWHIDPISFFLYFQKLLITLLDITFSFINFNFSLWKSMNEYKNVMDWKGIDIVYKRIFFIEKKICFCR